MGKAIHRSICVAVDDGKLTQLLAQGDHISIHNYLHKYILWCCRRRAARCRDTYEEIYADIVFLLETRIEHARTLTYGALYLLKLLSRAALRYSHKGMSQLQDVPINSPIELSIEDLIELEPFEYTVVNDLIAGYTQRDIASRYHLNTTEVNRMVGTIRGKITKWQKQNL